MRIGESFSLPTKQCLVVDVEPTDKSVTKIGKHSYRTEKQAEALAILTMGVSWLISPFFANDIVRTHYLHKGEMSEAPVPKREFSHKRAADIKLFEVRDATMSSGAAAAAV